MKNLSTQEILELLRTLEHRGVSREEVLRAIFSDVEKHKEIGEFFVMRAQKGVPKKGVIYETLSNEVIAIRDDGVPIVTNYSDFGKVWDGGRKIKSWYDFGCRT